MGQPAVELVQPTDNSAEHDDIQVQLRPTPQLHPGQLSCEAAVMPVLMNVKELPIHYFSSATDTVDQQQQEQPAQVRKQFNHSVAQAAEQVDEHEDQQPDEDVQVIKEEQMEVQNENRTQEEDQSNDSAGKDIDEADDEANQQVSFLFLFSRLYD